ncbi:MAG: transcription termination factor NusA [Parachlamydiales bacterium]|jgi:N utilization substance protein A
MNKDLIAIFEYLEREKGIKREIVIKALEEALKMAAKKSVQEVDNANVNIDPKTGEIDITCQKTVVEEVDDPQEEISLTEALKLTEDAEIGQRLEISIMPEDFGRIAAQTARQVISQKLRGAERDVIYEEYRHRVGEIISGTVKRFLRGRTMVVDMGKVEAILPERNYPETEKHHIGEKVGALLLEVHDTENGGAEVILSRAHPEFVSALFTQEVPELSDSTISIEKIVREAGYRTKMAVKSSDPKVDPVGTCVGVKGTRIKNIIRELNGEKIDVIPFSEDRISLLKNALSPATILRLKEEPEILSIIVSDEDYPTVLGKKGMNIRLTAKLIDKELKVKKMTEYQKLIAVYMAELADSSDPLLDQSVNVLDLSKLLIESLKSAGFETIRQIASAKALDITTAAPGVNYLDLAEKILEKRGS